MGGPSSSSVRRRQAERRISKTQHRGIVLLMEHGPAQRIYRPVPGWRLKNGGFIFPGTMRSFIKRGFAFLLPSTKSAAITTSGIAVYQNEIQAVVTAHKAVAEASHPLANQLVRGGM